MFVNGAGTSGGYTIAKSLRFRSSASAYLVRTPGSAGSLTTWTASFWFKRGALGTEQHFLEGQGGVGNQFYISTGDVLVYRDNSTSYITTTQVFRDPAAHQHLIVVWDTTNATAGNRLRIYLNGSLVASSSVTLNQASTLNSVIQHTFGRYNSGASGYFDGYLSEINFIDGQALTPASFGQTDSTTGQWVPKKYTGTYGTNGFYLPFNDGTSTTTLGYDRSGRSNTFTYSEQIDNAAWTKAGLNAFGSGSTADATTAPNGTSTADLITENSATAQRYALQVVSGVDLTQRLTLSVYAKPASGARYLGLGIANNAATANLVRAVFDVSSGTVTSVTSGGNGTGASATISAVGSGWYRCTLTGIPDSSGTQARGIIGLSNTTTNYLPSYTGDGTSGLYVWGAQLEQAAAASEYLPTVSTSAPNGNNWTASAGITLTPGATYDWMDDTPTNNFTVLNPLDNYLTSGVLSSANLKTNFSSGGAWTSTRSTVQIPSSGQWYWEATPTITNGAFIGIANSALALNNYAGSDGNSWSYSNSGQKYTGATPVAYGATYTTNDVIGVAFDASAGSLTFYKNGVSQGVAFTGLTSGNYFPALSMNLSGWDANFGQRPFTYTPPTGFNKLCTANLPAPTIKKPALHFDVLTYTGDGTDKNVTGTLFQPDLVAVKIRNQAFSNNWNDSVRGTLARLQTDTTAAEAATGIKAFLSNGFTTNGSVGELGYNTGTFVSWLWKANGAAVSNTSGSITSQVSANTTAGFSIVTYTGTGANATVGHGLGVAPKIVIVKNRDGSPTSWGVWHSALGVNEGLELQTTGAKQTGLSVWWNGATPTSSVFSIGTSGTVNGSTQKMVAYCFAEIPGFSKIGSYTGNASTDGPFVWCGFKPRWVMIKRTDSTGNWLIFDTARSTYNLMNNMLYPNLSNAEDTAWSMDFCSGGMKVRDNGLQINASSGTFIFIAFAEAPFNYATAR
jgi:hypothetical protein